MKAAVLIRGGGGGHLAIGAPSYQFKEAVPPPRSAAYVRGSFVMIRLAHLEARFRIKLEEITNTFLIHPKLVRRPSR